MVNIRALARSTWWALLGLAAACAPPPDTAAPRLEQLERETARIEAELRETRAHLVAEAPFAGLPVGNEKGEPLPIAPDSEKGEPIADVDPDCPELIISHIRAERGTACADYQAEISSYVGRCVAACDADAIATRTVRIAMNVCSQFCSEKNCGTASFVPPEAGCRAGDCFSPASDCRGQRCPLREYCGLLSTDRVWNCFCRDIVPT